MIYAQRVWLQPPTVLQCFYRRMPILFLAAPNNNLSQAVCALGSCPDGPDSVIIGESETHRILLAEETWRRPQRRLADLEDVVFGMFTAGGSRDGKALTESQQAALLFNTIANPVRNGVDSRMHALNDGAQKYGMQHELASPTVPP